MITEKEFDAFVEKGYWHYAKTYEKISVHWYVVRQEFADDRFFDDVVLFIRENAIPVNFRGKEFQCYFHNGYKYWTMGNPISQTRIINRNKI